MALGTTRSLLPVLCAALMLILLTPTPAAAGDLQNARSSALAYLAQASDAGAADLSANIVEAAVANGLDPATWPRSPGIQVAVPGPQEPFITLLRPLRALALANDARAANLTERVLAGFDGTQFGSPTQLNDDAYAVLALRAAGLSADDERLQAAGAFLQGHQNLDGGWGWAIGRRSGTDLTGMVLLALQATGGVPVDAQRTATEFLRTTQTQGGFGEYLGSPVNCESTAWGIRAWSLAGNTPTQQMWDFLLELQGSNGGFSHTPGGPTDVLCSIEATTVLGEAAAGRLAFSSSAPRDHRLVWALGIVVAGAVLAATLRRFRQS